MRPIILNNLGQTTSFQVLDSLFNGAEGAAEERFRDSLIFDDFRLVVVLSCEGKPVAYCSFRPYLTSNFNNAWQILNVQIDYVYVDPEYRGLGFTKIMVPVVIECCLEVAKSKEDVKELVDVSQYIGSGGYSFGCKVFQGLCDAA